ncbi:MULTISPECIES: DUF3326 domain-containing protein [unclassified Prochlorococcus]|uniref:DUF3326 domain-containing protein n=1 Tax=unclassified Prochlorococcus TaxID=2627481 RepID=UPI000533A56B|nr:MULTISPECIES: DUF3326 domain-containing protein [unclassified Prochlorococcus]KGG14792.1 hypothetical protein EV06_1855 [Prochlorococcus sp. MIT 0602]KGG15774.1 hypothetical protein EV07_1739 [Prochlorococcus sp. MIT 0603]
MNSSAPLPALLLIPTGIGCEVGGFAGDAIPFARLLAAASGCLITHPNVMNGASLFWNDERIQYVEGFSIDKFACGDLLLRPVRKQTVGVLFDAGLEAELRQRHLQSVDGCRATLGLDIGPVVTTESPLEISLKESSSGSGWGELLTVETLLTAGEKLKDAGATAIAVVTRFPDVLESKQLDAYRKGRGVDLMGGAEAIISHVLVRHLSLPCAHAPALFPLPMEDSLDPRAAGEELGYTFLPCVLVGLSRAPDLIPTDNLKTMRGLSMSDLIGIEKVGAVIAPEGALGGEAVLGCIERDIPLIIVSNPGVLKVDLESLGLSVQSEYSSKIITASNYLEAASLLLSLREGIAISSLKRPIRNVSVI